MTQSLKTRQHFMLLFALLLAPSPCKFTRAARLCTHCGVWMYINYSLPSTHSSNSSPLLSPACCRLPKYLSRSCQHLSAQQLERLRGTPSLSILIPNTPSRSKGCAGGKITVSLFQAVVRICFLCQSQP